MNNEQPTIFLDMDGVLSNFDLQLSIKFKEYGITEDAYLAHKNVTPSFVKIMEVLGHKFFTNIPPSPYIDWWKDIVLEIPDHIKVKILSASDDWGIGGSSSIAKQKQEWIEVFFHYADEVIVVENANDKSRYASKFSLLIDDSKQNIDSFKENGGRAILYNMNCHLSTGYDVVIGLKNFIKEFS